MELKELLGITEDYQIPDALMDSMMDDKKREELFKCFEDENVERDFFRSYFETNQADRKNFMQDLTPDCVGEIVAGIVGHAGRITDVCSGTGGLFVKVWKENRNAYFRLEEYSTAALPFSVFNMAIRNATGDIVHENALTREVYAVYHLEAGEKYSSVSMKLVDEELLSDAVVSNPPYSQKWDDVDNFKNDERFREFGTPPKSKADYGFLLHGYSKLKPRGIMVVIMPHGILFRGQGEGKIRKALLESGAIEAVIGLPENLFTNTSIPVCLIVLRKERPGKEVLFVDASREFRKMKNINTMDEEHIKKVLEVYGKRECIEKFSYISSFEEIEKNDFNLNIPRFVDTYEPEILPDLDEIVKGMREIERGTRVIEDELLDMMEKLQGTTEDAREKLERALKDFREYVKERKKEPPYEVKLDFYKFDSPKWMMVKDIADVERAVKGKIYPAGSTLIPLSAVNKKDIPLYLEKDGEVDSRYAVITFKIPGIPKYLWYMVCGSFPGFVHRYATGLNLQFEALNHLEIPTYRLEEQQMLVNEMDRQDRILERESRLMEKWVELKATMLELMFPTT